jgi:hypothetical protein
MTSSSEQYRSGFERWVTTARHPEGGYRLEKTISGEYINAETRCAFWGWVGSKLDTASEANSAVIVARS